MRHSRRNFLGAALRGQGNPLRPPWAIAEAAFLNACTRCHACIAACPTGLLGAGSGGYPEAMFVRDGMARACTFCGDCVQQCASGALLREGAVVPWSLNAVIGDACLTQRGVICHTCRESCEVDAIGYALQGAGIQAPRVDVGRCNGCGECLADCPTQAIHMRQANTNSFSLRGVA